jgi:hypothetical protein
MFLVSAPASAYRALSEDICSSYALLICVDPRLGVPGGHSRLLSAFQIFVVRVWPHPA